MVVSRTVLVVRGPLSGSRSSSLLIEKEWKIIVVLFRQRMGRFIICSISVACIHRKYRHSLRLVPVLHTWKDEGYVLRHLHDTSDFDKITYRSFCCEAEKGAGSKSVSKKQSSVGSVSVERFRSRYSQFTTR